MGFRGGVHHSAERASNMRGGQGSSFEPAGAHECPHHKTGRGDTRGNSLTVHEIST